MTPGHKLNVDCIGVARVGAACGEGDRLKPAGQAAASPVTHRVTSG